MTNVEKCSHLNVIVDMQMFMKVYDLFSTRDRPQTLSFNNVFALSACGCSSSFFCYLSFVTLMYSFSSFTHTTN